MSPLVRPACTRRAAAVLGSAPLGDAERSCSAQALCRGVVTCCMRLSRAHKGLRKLLPAFLPGDPSLCITLPSPPAPTACHVSVYITPCTAGVDKYGHQPLLTGPITVSGTPPIALHLCTCTAPVMTHTRMHTCYQRLVPLEVFCWETPLRKTRGSLGLQRWFLSLADSALLMRQSDEGWVVRLSTPRPREVQAPLSPGING